MTVGEICRLLAVSVLPFIQVVRALQNWGMGQVASQTRLAPAR